MDPKGHAESPAHHRFPVWWTGDGVNLQASVEATLDLLDHYYIYISVYSSTSVAKICTHWECELGNETFHTET